MENTAAAVTAADSVVVTEMPQTIASSPGAVGVVPASAPPAAEPETDVWHPPTSKESYERMVSESLGRQRSQLRREADDREATVRSELQPQLDELQAIRDAEKTEIQRLTDDTAAKDAALAEALTLAERYERQALILGVVAETGQKIDPRFFPLIEGGTKEEVAESVSALVDGMKAMAGVEAVDPTTGSIASPPAVPQARDAAPQAEVDALARIERLRNGDPDQVKANREKYFSPVGIAR